MRIAELSSNKQFVHYNLNKIQMIQKIKTENLTGRTGNRLLSRSRINASDDEHQMEFVGQVNGTAYINDSFSLTINATENSLKAVETSVILIIGGNDTANDYSLLADQINNKVVAIIYLGEYSDKILKHYLGHSMLFSMANDIKEAVSIADAYSRPGDAVLFSPACSSGNESDPYKSRGKEFKEIVKALMK
jgi:UDP-N-acetylmuramoylalanine--D-glutamate ligase